MSYEDVKGVQICHVERTVHPKENSIKTVFEIVVLPHATEDDDLLRTLIYDDLEMRIRKDSKVKALKDFIEKEMGERPDGVIADYTVTETADEVFWMGSRTPDEINRKYLIDCTFEEAIDLAGLKPTEGDGSFLTEVHGESFKGSDDITNAAHDAMATAQGVSAGESGIEFEAVCTECGGDFDSDQGLDETLCSDCQGEACQVDGCNAMPDDFHEHMIGEHGWYDPTMDPTTDET